MLNLRRDLFIRMAISSQKNRVLNRPFRVAHVEFYKSLRRKNIEPSALDKMVSDIPLPESDHPAQSSSAVSVVSKDSPAVEKIEDKVEKIITNPHLIEIQLDLEIAEQLLAKIKEVDLHNPKIPLIEQTIIRLKLMLEQKSYV